LISDNLFVELIDILENKYSKNELKIVHQAYEFAKNAHKNQKRSSGDEYIVHPIHVALNLAELNLDIQTVVAGILHDIVEDTRYTQLDIKNFFGEEIANLVDGVTNLEKVRYKSNEKYQADGYRKLFLSMAKDIRVVLIKIADRLYNMQTLIYVSEEKQKIKAQETLDIYAPIAHRLGISKIRYELEDLAFFFLNPKEYEYISKKIKFNQRERISHVDRIINEIKKCLKKNKINAKIEGRPKHFFSVYRKMKIKNKTFEQIYDLFAVRILVNEIQDCYQVLGILHDYYKPVPGRFKDYIAVPKANMYQSLHTTLVDKNGLTFEIQIRTYKMNQVAEYGIAAHWMYKENIESDKKNDDIEKRLTWLKQILEWQKNFDDEDYLKALKLDLNVFSSRIYCFTPRGKVLCLSDGSTPLDFAYAIHSEIGNKAVRAKVNNRIVNFNYKLKNGDCVEIITSKNSYGPKLSWIKIVKTNHAKNKISQFFKKINKPENINKGRTIVEEYAQSKNINLDKLLESEEASIFFKKNNFDCIESFYLAVAHNAINSTTILNKLCHCYKKINNIQNDIEFKKNNSNIKNKNTIVINGLGDTQVRFSQCCNPLPGDEIVVFITRGRGLSLHKKTCKNITHIEIKDHERLINASWSNYLKYKDFNSSINITYENQKDVYTQIIKILANEDISITNANFKRKKEINNASIEFRIKDKSHLQNLIDKLSKILGVYKVL
jgi:GTP pyrophosphokinase